MPTMQERFDGIASVEIALGRLRPDASPAEREAAINAVLDANDNLVEARATELQHRLGAGEHYPAAA
ncbi:hypothetical protein ACFYUY_01475 [Kitasatospora sp. NPDC004745]|uniref:hypothetical protein n=1 Tax=Kitasatospora sp. NPDC004745 TaxID=3364019 RepID=UPI0036871071